MPRENSRLEMPDFLRLAKHLAVCNICATAFAPGCYVVGLHVLQCPNLCAVRAVPDGTMRAVGDACLPRTFRLHSPSVVNAFLYVLLSRPFGVRTRISSKSVTKLRKLIRITNTHRHKSTMNNRKCVLFCFKRPM